MLRVVLAFSIVGFMFMTASESIELRSTLLNYNEQGWPLVVCHMVDIFVYGIGQLVCAVGLIWAEMLEFNRRMQLAAEEFDEEEINAG